MSSQLRPWTRGDSIVGPATALLVATTLVTGIADQAVDQLDRTVQAFLESRRGRGVIPTCLRATGVSCTTSS